MQESDWIQPVHEIDGPGICGLHHPFKVRGLADGTVTITSAAILDCSMIPALDGWIKTVLQPAAMARFGEPIVEIKTMGSYNCRGINNEGGANLSEHAFGNAVDIASFVLQSGRELNIRRGWNSADDQERAFLHEAHGGACGYFTTVLGPGSNVFHYNHYHLDLAMHGNTSRGPRRICKPVPENALPSPPVRDNLPDPPPIAEEQDMASAAGGASGYAGPGRLAPLVLAAPAQASAGQPSDVVPRPPLEIGADRRSMGSEGDINDPDRRAGSEPNETPAAWDLTSSIRKQP